MKDKAEIESTTDHYEKLIMILGRILIIRILKVPCDYITIASKCINS